MGLQGTDIREQMATNARRHGPIGTDCQHQTFIFRDGRGREEATYFQKAGTSLLTSNDENTAGEGVTCVGASRKAKSGAPQGGEVLSSDWVGEEGTWEGPA